MMQKSTREEKYMSYYLAELNIAKFRLPQEHPDNADFIAALDRVNAIAELSPGFIWRFTGEGNDAMDVQAFDDPHIASNLSLWKDVESLTGFVYENKEHLSLMRRRKEWFDKMEFYVVLWWVKVGNKPSLEDAKERLELLTKKGASKDAFTFRQPFAKPNIS